MIEDMAIRKFAQKTQHDYLQRVKEFARYLDRSPDTAEPEDVRGFQLHCAGVSKINNTISALRFFFNVTHDRPDLSKHLSTVHRPRKVPVVLSPDEVARFLEAAPGSPVGVSSALLVRCHAREIRFVSAVKQAQKAASRTGGNIAIL